ncbi:MAG: hypothetical protein JWO06_1470 [Bacteroidota bacterium]|nr:hypothetical protein [Bacteroidota bacterium]
MDLTVKKREIKAGIDKIEDEKLVWAIARLLHLDDEGEIPEWHKQVVEERVVKYGKSNSKLKDWDKVQGKL